MVGVSLESGSIWGGLLNVLGVVGVSLLMGVSLLLGVSLLMGVSFWGWESSL